MEEIELLGIYEDMKFGTSPIRNACFGTNEKCFKKCEKQCRKSMKIKSKLCENINRNIENLSDSVDFMLQSPSINERMFFAGRASVQVEILKERWDSAKEGYANANTNTR